MKLLFIADPSSEHTKKWLNCFAENNNRVSLISYYNRPKYAVQDVLDAGYFKTINKNPLLFIKYCLSLRKIIQKIKPDILTCHYALGGPGLIASIADFHPLVIVVSGGIDLYGTIINPLRSLVFGKFLLKYIFNAADLIIVGCHDHKQYLIKNGLPEKKILILPGPGGIGVNLSLFHSNYNLEKIRQELNLNKNFVLFCPRRITPYTNIDLIIKSIPIIKEQIPEIKLLLINYAAQNKYFNYLKNLVKTFALEDNIIFSNEMALENMPQLYCASNCTISISSFDGTPLSIAESMACDVPVIANNLPSITEWVKNNITGKILNDLGPETIAKSVIEVYHNKEEIKAIIENGAQFVKEHLDLNKNKEKLKKIYTDIYNHEKYIKK